MILEGIVSSAICQLLDLIGNRGVVLLCKFGILTLELALDSFLLRPESVLVSARQLHLFLELLVSLDLVVELGAIATLVLIDSTQVLLELVVVLLVCQVLGCGRLLDLAQLLSLLELSLVLSASLPRLKLVLKLVVLLGKVLLDLLFDLLLRVLEVLKHILEVLIAAGILQLLLELSQLLVLLNDEELLELLFLLFSLSLIRGQVLLELCVDVLDGIVHLSLLLSLVVTDLVLHLVKLLGNLLALLTSGIETTGEKLVLASLILLHHVLNSLNLFLEFTDKAFDLLTGSTLLLEHVLQAGATLMSIADLLLENGVLLAVDVDDHLIRVPFERSFELFIFSLAPGIIVLLVRLGVVFSLLALLVGVRGLVLISVQAVHVAFSLFHEVIVVLALQDPLIGSEDALEFCDLLVQLVGLLVVVGGEILVLVRLEIILVLVLAAYEFLNLDEMLL